MDGSRGEVSKVSRIARENEGDVSLWQGMLDLKSHDDTSGRIEDDDDSTNELLQRFRNQKSSNESQKKSDNDKMISTIPDSYSITPEEKAKITAYLDSCKTNVNFLKKRLIDLLLDLAFKNIDTQLILASNDRSNADRAYNTFNTTDLYNYDLNDFVHYEDERYNDYKEINEIVYKLKFINIIYLILQNNASQGDTPSEYKEPAFKYKGLITEDLLNGEKGLNKDTFKKVYAEFRANNPLVKKDQSLPTKGGNSPTKYKSTGITVSIMYEKKKYKRTVYTKDNRKTKYCKIDGEYILLSKIKNLSNKNPQRTSPKSRGGLGEDGDLDTKIKTYLDDSVGTANFLKHRLVYKLLEYMNSADVKLKFDKDSTNVFKVYNSFKDQGTKGLYVYDLKSFQLYNDEEDKKYKEINNIVYKLKLINIVYLILKNKFSRGDTLNKYIGNNFEYELKSLFKDGTERALDQALFKAAYQIWIKNNKPIENKKPDATGGQPTLQAKPVETPSLVQNTPDKVKSAYEEVINKLKEFIITYNKVEPNEDYKLEKPKENMDNLENLKFSKNKRSFFKTTTFSEDTRWNKWTASGKNETITYINTNIGNDLKKIDGAITEARNAYTTFEKGQDNKTGIENAIAKIEELNKRIDITIKEKIGIKLYNTWKPKAGGNPPTKYKSTGITVYILYEKKKYKRTVYTKDNRKTKYCKINNKYILLSKLNVIE